MSTKLSSVIANKAQQPMLEKMVIYKVERKNMIEIFLFFTVFLESVGGKVKRGIDCFRNLRAMTETNK